MRDLGIEVELVPKLDRSKFDAAVKGMKLKIPVSVDETALAASIQRAVSRISVKNIKIDLSTAFDSGTLSAGIQQAVKTSQTAAGHGKNENLAAMSAAQVKRAQTELQKWQNSVARITKKGVYNPGDLQALRTQIENVRQATAGTKEYAAALDQAGKSYRQFQQSARLLASEQTAQRQAERSDTHLNNIYTQISDMMRKSPRIKEDGELLNEFQAIQKAAKTGNADWQELENRFSRARAKMRELGLESETAGQHLRRLFKDHFNTAIAMAGLHLLQNSLREIYQNVFDIDTAMTNLRKVSSGTQKDYAVFLDGSGARAKKLGATMTDVIDATSEFARLGYDLSQSAMLGDAAVMYKNVSEYEDVGDAAQSLVSAMKAFDVEADQVGQVVDKFNEVGNNYAISSQGLGEALQRSAAALANGGNTLDESIGLVTGANEIVQNPEVVGEHMRPAA